MPKLAQFHRSIIFAGFACLMVFAFVYLAACYRVNSKIPNYNYIADSFLLLLLVQGSILLAMLFFLIKIHRFEPVRINDAALKKFAQKHAPIFIAAMIVELLLGAFQGKIGLAQEARQNIGNWLFLLTFVFVLYRGELAIYRFIVNRINRN